MISEIWKPVPGFEGDYEISNLGNVVSLKFGRRQTMKQTPWKGYLTITFRSKGRRKSGSVHTFVAWAFLGPVPDGCEVDHKDTDKTHNSVDNLEYVTHAENMRRAAKNGCIKLLGKDRKGSVLTDEMVFRAREAKSTWGGLSALSRELKVGRSTLQAAADGHTYKHI